MPQKQPIQKSHRCLRQSPPAKTPTGSPTQSKAQPSPRKTRIIRSSPLSETTSSEGLFEGIEYESISVETVGPASAPKKSTSTPSTSINATIKGKGREAKTEPATRIPPLIPTLVRSPFHGIDLLSESCKRRNDGDLGESSQSIRLSTPPSDNQRVGWMSSSPTSPPPGYIHIPNEPKPKRGRPSKAVLASRSANDIKPKKTAKLPRPRPRRSLTPLSPFGSPHTSTNDQHSTENVPAITLPMEAIMQHAFDTASAETPVKAEEVEESKSKSIFKRVKPARQPTRLPPG
jgi:hypothetical protein